MRSLFVLATIALTVLCWGVYGPVLHHGQVGFVAPQSAKLTRQAIQNNGLRAFMCVGLAYFAIAVVVPTLLLKLKGEQGHWTFGGTIWSLLAGAAGAIGALGIIIAFQFGGEAIYVMPLVFGGAPVVNSFLTIYWAKAFRQIGPMFYAGLILVLLGSVTVLISTNASGFLDGWKTEVTTLIKVLCSVSVVILAWGVYGPTLHKGQMAMNSSRLRPLICVGLSYFLIAVLVPGAMLLVRESAGEWRATGIAWSIGAGAAGAIGALGIVMCFNFGGKPIFVMPLIFGGAPVVNTLIAMAGQNKLTSFQPWFYAGLILVCTGAAIVLVFAPRGHGPSPAVAKKPAEGKKQKAER